jgi:hypothetical protein
MGTVVPRISRAAAELVAEAIDSIRHEPARVRAGSVDDQWGRSESIDPDNVGDIADEGAGHRG